MFSHSPEIWRTFPELAAGVALLSGMHPRVATVHRVAAGLRTGTVWVNGYQLMDAAIPFGGYKMSGFGRESGAEHMQEYLQTKSVILRLG